MADTRLPDERPYHRVSDERYDVVSVDDLIEVHTLMGSWDGDLRSMLETPPTNVANGG